MRLAKASLTTWLIWGFLALAFLGGLLAGRYTLAFVAAATFGASLVPFLVASRLHIRVPNSFMAAIVAFIFATLFLGEANNFYERYWWWDVMLHAGSAMGFGLIGFIAMFMLFQGDRYVAPPLAIGLFAFCFAVTIGALWEIFEYAMDVNFGLNMQKNGLQDTMWDLVLDAGGGLIGAGSGVIYLYREGEGSGPLARLIREFIRLNRSYFRRFRRERREE